jgi:carbamoyltransferase
VEVILGLNAYHGDASAALVVDGELVNAVEEERLNRVKHSAGFPGLAARWCLADAGIDARHVQHVAISRDPKANLVPKLLRAARTPSLSFLRSRLAVAAQVRNVKGELATALQLPESELQARFHNVEHHRSHCASAFFVSPFEEAAVLSVDGFGDFASVMLARGSGNRIEVLDRVLFPHSLGLLYTAVTQWLGFVHYGDEGKVMGLAPYGAPAYVDELRKLVDDTAPVFGLALDYFTHHVEGVDMTWDQATPTLGPVYSQKLEQLLGPARERGAVLEKRHEDVAASLQRVTEEAYIGIIRRLHERVQSKNLALAGGVALNAVANGLIRHETPFEELYIQPAAGDNGTSIGAAYHVWHETLGRPRSFVMRHAYTGPQFEDAEIREAVAASAFQFRRLDDDELFPWAATQIVDGKVIGWFQGRAEFGPRALGNRSIVVDPRRHDMKDILNARIKHREPFRPFAPSVLAEEVGAWYEDDYPSPFMILVHKTRADRREAIPAVNHVDDTGRVQSVEADVNPRYYRLIEAFRDQTGVPILLNTSFNENEPIVCTPEEALACFGKTKMDILILGNYVLER